MFANSQTDYVYYSPADGLVQSNITTLFQDSQGFIWIGTQGGLSKFDGFEFTNFTTFEGLANNYIVKIIEDLNGNIWVLNRKSINKFDNNKFYSYSLDSANKFQDFDIDKNNEIWILDVAIQKQLLYTFSNNKFVSQNNLENHWIFDLFFSKQYNTLLSITNHGVYSLPKKTKLYESDSIIFKYCFNDYLGETYFVTDNSIFLFDNNSSSFSKTENTFVKTRLKDGVFIGFDQKNNSIYSFLSKNNIQKITKKQSIKDILVDNQENIWIGSDNGLYRITPFQNFSFLNNVYPNFTSIVEDNSKNIWFTSSNLFSANSKNLFIYNSEQNKIFDTTSFISSQSTPNNDTYFDNKTSFQYGTTKLSNGSIIFTTNQHFFYLYHQKKIEKIKFDELNKQFCVFEDTANKKIFFGTTNGLFVTNQDFSTYETINNLANVNQRVVTDIEKGSDGNIYFCTNEGIGIYDYKNLRFIHQDSVSVLEPMSIYKDFKGNLWFGALNGLFLYDYNTFKKINHIELKSNISAIEGSNNNTLIIGSVRGIGLLNLKTMYEQQDTTIRFYDNLSGFLGVEVILNGIFEDVKGNIWVTTKSHIIKFNPKKLTENLTAPITLITSKTYSDKNLNTIPISDTTNELLFAQNNISISYTGISHRAPNQVMYKYQLKGYDQTVSPATKKRIATYTNLPPGEYIFKVWACNESGIWNDEPTIWEFIITETIWHKRWFKYIFITFIIFATFFLTLAGVRFVYNRREYNRKIIDLQFLSFSNQIYPHFLFNAIANISGAIYTLDQDTAYDYTTKLTALIRQVQEDQKSIQRTLKNELIFVEKYLKIQKMRFEERFTYKFRIDPRINLNSKIPQMLIQTFVENAIKHSLEHLEEGGKLLIEGKVIKKNIVFTVQDNGMGFEASKNVKKINSGQGLNIINEVLKLYNRKYKTSINYKIISLNKYKLNGSRIEIFIPLKNL